MHSLPYHDNVVADYVWNPRDMSCSFFCICSLLFFFIYITSREAHASIVALFVKVVGPAYIERLYFFLHRLSPFKFTQHSLITTGHSLEKS